MKINRPVPFIIGLIAVGLSVSSLSQAAGEVTLGIPTYQGSGCPDASVGATLSPDSSTLSVLFDRFQAQAGQGSSVRLGRAECRLQVPVRLAAGYRAAITEVDFRGFMSLPQRGYAQLTVDYSLAGRSNPRFYRRFVGPNDQDYLANQIMRLQDYQWTGCSASPQNLNLSILAGFVVATNERNDQVVFSIDSQDLTSGMTYNLRIQRCP